MGLVVLVVLTTLAGIAAVAVVTRAGLRGRAETLVGASLLWNFLLVLPIYLLGFAGRLSARSLAVASPMVSVAALALAARGSGFRLLAESTGDACRGLLRLPVDAVIHAWRVRSFVLVGVIFVLGFWIYMALNAYLAAPLPMWDALWYHDPIVGFTIQNHGFAVVNLPLGVAQKTNAYPRLAEMTQLWLVIFTDRRFGDFANLLFAPALSGGVYMLARRYTGEVVAMGWGIAATLMPGNADLLQQTLVDPQNAALLVGGIAFATRDPLRLVDAWLAALGLALAVASKSLSVPPVAVTGAIVVLSVLRAHGKQRRRAAWLTIGGGSALVVAATASVYLRNYLAFHNPFWPDLQVDIKALGIHWPGIGGWREGGTQHVNINEPLSTLIEYIYALPWSVKGMNDIVVDYGIGVAWVVIPLGAVAFVACVVGAIRSLARPRGTAHDGSSATTPAPPVTARPPVQIALIVASIVATSPALWAPRYHIVAVGLVMALIAWLLRRESYQRLSESAVSIVLVTSVMMFFWAPPPHYRYWLTPAELAAEARLPFPQRELVRPVKCATSLATGMARERELGPGSLVVFKERYSAYLSLLWNLTYSNRIMYLPSGPDFLERAARAGATWVFLPDHDPDLVRASVPGSGWQDVGVLNPIIGGHAFRRIAVPRPPAPPPAPRRPVFVPQPQAPRRPAPNVVSPS